MDRTTTRAYVAAKVEDPNQTQFTSTQYNNAIDLAQQQFCIDAKAIVKESTLTSVAGTSAIALPSDFLVCILVRHKGLKLAPTTVYDLSFQSGQDWTTLPNGVPTMYFIDRQNDNLNIVVAPDSGNAGANVLLDYVAVPAALSADASTILGGDVILSYYAPAIFNWAAAELLTYVPLDAAKLQKRDLLLKDYERYKNEAIMVYNNMADQPIQMRGGKNWQDQRLYGTPNAFT